jgi:hypothetical protein
VRLQHIVTERLTHVFRCHIRVIRLTPSLSILSTVSVKKFGGTMNTTPNYDLEALLDALESAYVYLRDICKLPPHFTVMLQIEELLKAHSRDSAFTLQ